MRPILVLNPRSDTTFVDAANAAVTPDGMTPSALQRALRPAYPSVLVRARDLSNEPALVWYVYRDGHWVGAEEA